MLKKWMMVLLMASLWFGVAGERVFAQDAEAPGAGLELTDEAAEQPAKSNDGFIQVIVGSGAVGIILWLALFGCSIAGVALIVDSFITVRAKRIAPQSLVAQVQEAMEQGDVMKAIRHCEEEPGPLAHILMAGFTNVQEGFEAIQDAIGVAADMESEKLLQRVNYLNVVANVSPSLGLLGTVQGMIYAFSALATTAAGAAQQSALALSISQALYTTAAGLCVSIPAVTFYYFFKNKAMNIILSMEAKTMDLIKVLRNVEVVSE